MTGPVVLVVGRPAAGKTTLSRVIATELGLPLVGKDALKETLFDALGAGDRAWSQRLGRAAFDLLDQVIDLMLAGGAPLVVDSPFDAAFAGPRFADRAARYDVAWVQVHCVAPKQELLRRYAHRSASGERHPGHGDERGLDEFAASLDVPRAETFDLPGPLLTVDTTGETPHEVVERLRPLLA